MGAGALLAGCGIPPARANGQSIDDRSDIDKKLTWSNWQAYMDVSEEDETVYPTLVGFEEKYGIDVTYVEDVNDNTEYFSKIQPQLAAGQTISSDVFVVTDWMAARLIQLGYAQKLDHNNIPNLKNLAPALLNVGYDKGRNYSATWQSGFGGIAVNREVVGDLQIESMQQLFTEPSLNGRVTVLSEMRDTVGLTLQSLGYDSSDFTDSQFNEAINMIGEAVNSKQIRQFTGNDYTSGLASGDLAACVAWSGDVIALQADAPAIEMVLPEAGYTLWSDNYIIPILSAHKKNAELLIDYYYDPEVAATLAAWVNYITPVPAAKAFAEEIDPELAENQLIFPNEATLAKSHVFMELNEELDERYSRAFNKLSGA